ncbi:MAG: pyridoxal phosphate-dependent aminotransferase [Firmicutes bacterium]|nr:pyridoxal phosphate-dependent aminotransferase [Bacillota bacterium]
MKYDFDKVLNRSNTNSLKYDCAARRGMPSDLLPLWVADMDFQAPLEVLDALTKKAAHGIFGYSEPSDGYFTVLSKWLCNRFGWQPKREWLLHTPGIVYAVTLAIKAFTAKGDAVMIQPPVYYPFRAAVKSNNRKLINNPLQFNESTKRYEIDFADFERKIKENAVKLFILCSPHNPVGRVWTETELQKIGEICLRHNVLIVSDEIHADFVYANNKHHVFTQLNESFYKNSIICFSPSKTFNLAGLQFSDIFIADKNLRNAFAKEYDKSGYSQLNIFGIVAAEAAYKHGAQWLDQLIEYLETNVRFMDEFLKKHLPKIKLIKPEGTYLAWLDFKNFGLSQKETDLIIINKAKLWLDSGTIFGAEGTGFQRLNFACPRSVLQQSLENLKQAFGLYGGR